jgi:hypothetical protein
MRGHNTEPARRECGGARQLSSSHGQPSTGSDERPSERKQRQRAPRAMLAAPDVQARDREARTAGEKRRLGSLGREPCDPGDR